MTDEPDEPMSTTRRAGVPAPIALLICGVVFVVALSLALYVLLYLGRDGIMAHTDWAIHDPTGRLVTLATVAAMAAWGVWEARKAEGWTNRIWEVLSELTLLAVAIYVYLHW